jgi:transcription initiation factor TFIIIB Brf1 subunit/transcription initiation factor TFIIB
MASLLFPGLSAHKDPPSSSSSAKNDDWTSFFTEEKPVPSESAYTCPECLTDRWVSVDDEEAICKRCSTSLGYTITSSAEYRWFGADDRSPDPTRVGNPLNPLLPESSLGTRIIARPGEHRAMRKIRQYHLWNVMPYRERTLWNVFEMLQVRAANANISSGIVEETKQLYANISPLCICRGLQKDALMAACLFESLKRHDTPRRPGEIAEIFKIDIKLITRGVKQFAGLLDEYLHAEIRKATEEAAAAADKASTSSSSSTSASSTPSPASAESPVPPASETKKPAPIPIIFHPVTTPSTNFRHYLEPSILRLEAPKALYMVLESEATRMGTMLDEIGVCPETTPPSLAACAILLACQKAGVSKSSSEVAGVCGISVATLQKCMKRIEPWKSTLFGSNNAEAK